MRLYRVSLYANAELEVEAESAEQAVRNALEIHDPSARAFGWHVNDVRELHPRRDPKQLNLFGPAVCS